MGKLRDEAVSIIATKKDLVHLQYILELRWQVLNGCIRDPKPSQM